MSAQTHIVSEERLLDFLYGELPATAAAEISEHVKTCPQCTATLEGYRSTRRVMRQLPPEVDAPPARVTDALLAEARKAAAARAQPGLLDRVYEWLRGGPARFLLTPTFAVAGALALVVGGSYLVLSYAPRGELTRPAATPAPEAAPAFAPAPVALAPAPAGAPVTAVPMPALGSPPETGTYKPGAGFAAEPAMPAAEERERFAVLNKRMKAAVREEPATLDEAKESAARARSELEGKRKAAEMRRLAGGGGDMAASTGLDSSAGVGVGGAVGRDIGGSGSLGVASSASRGSGPASPSAPSGAISLHAFAEQPKPAAEGLESSKLNVDLREKDAEKSVDVVLAAPPRPAPAAAAPPPVPTEVASEEKKPGFFDSFGALFRSPERQSGGQVARGDRPAESPSASPAPPPPPPAAPADASESTSYAAAKQAPSAKNEAASTRAQAEQKQAPAFEPLYARAEAARRAGRLEEAARLYREAYVAAPDHARAPWALAGEIECLAALGRLADADESNAVLNARYPKAAESIGAADRALRMNRAKARVMPDAAQPAAPASIEEQSH
jgi:hypothetical protein